MIVAGKLKYSLGTSPVTGCGIALSVEELNAALAGPVASVIFDDTGKADLSTLLEGLADTEFEQKGIRRILEQSKTPENWRVGEALAECYLVDHRNCHFYWPDSRDERKSGSSLPGADIVGFQNDGLTDRFGFGEVKTSDDPQYPPGTMYGNTGLKQQIEDLRDKVSIRDDLVKYLGYRATTAVWRDRYINAAKRYLADNNDVRIFGVLIRDVPPHEDDIRVRVVRLRNGCSSTMAIELLAIYLPAGSIATLGRKVMSLRKGGAT